MTPRQKIEIRQSEIRLRLNSITDLDGTDYSDEIKKEETSLISELNQCEARLKTAILAEDPTPPDPDPQLVTLESRANLGSIFECAVNHRATDGAEAELQKEKNLKQNFLPLCLLESRALTPAPATGKGVGQREITPAVFPDSVHEFLGITTTTVPAGQTSFPHLTTSAAPTLPAESGSVDASVGAFSTTQLAAKRIQASFSFSRESQFAFAGMADALRSNLTMALADGLDKAIVAELLKAGTLDNHNASEVDTFVTVRNRLLYDAVDGIFASHIDQLRVLLGPASFRFAGSLYRGGASELSAAESLGSTNSLRISPHVTAIASSKQNAIVRRGTRNDSALPLWEGIQIIADDITGAATGTIHVTALLGFNFAITRKDGWVKTQLQTWPKMQTLGEIREVQGRVLVGLAASIRDGNRNYARLNSRNSRADQSERQAKPC